jgi:hypothetical protein
MGRQLIHPTPHCFTEEAMPARTTRQAARERVLKTMIDALDRVIPPDESVPLRGATFRDFEDQVAQVRRAVMPTLLEERAALDDHALAGGGGGGGCCPHCGAAADRVYLKSEEVTSEIMSPDGPVVVPRQSCRCRACDGTFSPSAP